MTLSNKIRNGNGIWFLLHFKVKRHDFHFKYLQLQMILTIWRAMFCSWFLDIIKLNMSVRFWPLYDKIYCEKTLLNRKNNILAGYWYCELICRNGAPMIHLDGETSSLLELKRSSCLTQGRHILRRVWFAPLNNLAKGKMWLS